MSNQVNDELDEILDFDKCIATRVAKDEPGFDGIVIDLRLRLTDAVKAETKQAIKQWAYEQVLEIIGDDDEYNPNSKKESHFNAKRKGKNQLRAEQRQAAKTKFGIEE